MEPNWISTQKSHLRSHYHDSSIVRNFDDHSSSFTTLIHHDIFPISTIESIKNNRDSSSINRNLQGWPSPDELPLPDISNSDTSTNVDDDIDNLDGPGVILMLAFFFLFFLLTAVKIICFEIPRDRRRRREMVKSRRRSIRMMLLVKTVILKKQPSVIMSTEEEETIQKETTPRPPPLKPSTSASFSYSQAFYDKSCSENDDTSDVDPLSAPTATNNNDIDDETTASTIEQASNKELKDQEGGAHPASITNNNNKSNSESNNNVGTSANDDTSNDDTTNNNTATAKAKLNAATRRQTPRFHRQKTNLIIYSEGGDDEDLLECPICLSPYQSDEKICWSYNEECEHAFHLKCIKPWLMKHDECPCCRNMYLMPPPEAQGEGLGNNNGGHSGSDALAATLEGRGRSGGMGRGDEENPLDEMDSIDFDYDDDTATTVSAGGGADFVFPQLQIPDEYMYNGSSWATALFLQNRAFAGSHQMDRYIGRGGSHGQIRN